MDFFYRLKHDLTIVFFLSQKKAATIADINSSSYFYSDEAMQFTYFRIPCQLITHPRFKHLSTDSKLLYGMLLDRMSLSIKNEWYDDTGRVYIYYTVDEVCSSLNCGRDKAMRLLAELDTGKGVGLIERKKQGQGKPTQIYVKRFTTQEMPPQPEKKPEPPSPPPGVKFDDVENRLEHIVDVISSIASTMRIGGEVLPVDAVKRRFRQLDSEHIKYVIDSLQQTTTKINNIRAYLLTALYNAPITIGPYYSAAVRHDFG